MKRVLLPLIASVLCLCKLADAQTVTTSATIDQACVPRDTIITIPAGRIATGFTPTVSSGVYCTTGGRVANPAWGISSANACRSGNTFYQNRNDSGKTSEIPIPLADLRLVPGQYCLHVDGGKGAKVTLTYSLVPGGGGGPGPGAGGGRVNPSPAGVAETNRIELSVFSFVKYRGDLSHGSWNPRNASVVYKSFEVSDRDSVRVRIDDKGHFEGVSAFLGVNPNQADTSRKISGTFSPDRKMIVELTAEYTFKIDVREQRWSLTIRDIPLHETSDLSDQKVFEYSVEGSDATCQLVPLDKHVVSISDEHRFPGGGSVVLDEVLLNKQICNLDAISRPGGFYNLVDNYQVPSIRVKLHIQKDVRRP